MRSSAPRTTEASAAKRRWPALWAAIAAAVIWHCWCSSFNHDEIEHLHAAWLISAGQLPYRDFLEQHHPTLWFAAAPLVDRFASVRSLVFAARLFNAMNMLALLWLVRRILRRLYPQTAWQLPVLLLLASFMFVRNSIEFRPDPAMNVGIYAGILNWLAFLQEGRIRRAAAAGLCVGLAIAILQKALVILALIAAAAGILIIIRARRREPLGRLALAVGAMIGSAALFAGGLAASMSALGIFQDFWFWNYPFNRFFYMEAQLPEHFSLPNTIGRSILVDPVLWAAGCTGAWLWAKRLWSARPFAPSDEGRFSVLFLAAGYLTLLSLNRFPLDQYLLVLLPLLALFGAEPLSAGNAMVRLLAERATLVMPLVLITLLLLYPKNEGQLRVQRFVLRRTSEDQPVFVPPAFNPVFRRDSAYFWYNGELIGQAYQQYCRRTGRCANEKLALDDKRWASSPPAFVFLESPAHYPYHWNLRSGSYQPSRLPGLWEREDKWALRRTASSEHSFEAGK